MKQLEIKDSGAWRKVVSFEPAQEQTVMKAGQALMEAIGHPKIAMRVSERVDGQAVVLALCESPGWEWSTSNGM